MSASYGRRRSPYILRSVLRTAFGSFFFANAICAQWRKPTQSSRAPQLLFTVSTPLFMANVWVMYDIRKDRNRTRIAKFCKRIGLHRVQKSIFYGQLPKKMIRRMAKEMNRGINTQTDNLVILTVPPKALNEAIRLGNSPDFVAKANDRIPKFF